MSQPVCNSGTLVGKISAFSGGLSFTSNLVASIPQLIETYQQKSVEGLSVILVSVWVIGDITSFIGCFLTNQMFFQYILSLYFLFNDCILVGQYYYYGYYLKKHHPYHQHPHHRHSQGDIHHHHHSHDHSHGHQSEGHEYGSTTNNRKYSTSSISGSIARAAIPAAVIASNIVQGDAFPIPANSSTEIGGFTIDSKTYGLFFAWFGAALYFFSRIPQLLKNHERKSTEDVSPILFACMLFGNITYTVSILVSCDFIYGNDRWGFFLNELPYIIGSAGTIIFDIFYFYQVWLYKDQSPVKSNENEPLLSSD